MTNPPNPGTIAVDAVDAARTSDEAASLVIVQAIADTAPADRPMFSMQLCLALASIGAALIGTSDEPDDVIAERLEFARVAAGFHPCSLTRVEHWRPEAAR